MEDPPSRAGQTIPISSAMSYGLNIYPTGYSGCARGERRKSGIPIRLRARISAEISVRGDVFVNKHEGRNGSRRCRSLRESMLLRSASRRGTLL